MLCEPIVTNEATTAPPQAELSLQGDDFTRQMWQMYAVFEDLLERPSSHGRIASSAIPLQLMQQFGDGQGSGPSPAMLAEVLTSADGIRLLESYERMIAEPDYDGWSTVVVAPRDVEDESDDEDDGDDDEVDLVKRGIHNEMKARGRQMVFEDSTTEFDSDEVLEAERRYHHHYQNQFPQTGFQSSQHQQRTLRRHRHRMRRRLPATPTARTSAQGYHHQNRLVEELTRSTPSVHMGEGAVSSSGVDIGISSNPVTLTNDSNLSFRRSSAPELLDNPLLETISTIEDLCESDDYGEARANKVTPLNSSNNSSGLSVDKDSTKTVKSDPSSSAEEKAQHSSDGDRDSVGYAGSNSVDSGYKSSCPTPELLDPCYYAQDALCNGSKRYSLASRASREGKPRIPMGTRVIGRHHHHQARSAPTSNPWSMSASGSPAPSSGSGGRSSTSASLGGATVSGATSSNRPEYGYYDVNLDHLMYLRQSLLSAIKRCGGSVSPARISPDDSESSGATGAAHRSDSRHSSPMRSRSNSRTSRHSPDQRKISPSPSSSPQFSHLRGARCRTDAAGKSEFVYGSSPPFEARACSPNMISSSLSGHLATSKCESPKSPRSPRTSEREANKTIEQDDTEADKTAIATLEEEIDTLLYGKAEYYDLESVQEFPCSYGTMVENKYRSSSLAKVKKLKDSSHRDQEQDHSFPTKLTQQSPNVQSSSAQSVGSHSSSISDKLESMVPEMDRLLAATTDHASSSGSVPQDSLISQGPASYGCKDNPDTCQEVPADKVKFSEVAKCMLKIIEDIQHQQQNSSPTISSDTKTHGGKGSSKDSQNGRRTSASVYDSKRLSGADYHVYEEITYDLVSAASGGNILQEHPKHQGSDPRLSARRFKRQDIPPPLPARPNEIFGTMPAQGKQLSASFGSLGHQQGAYPQTRNLNVKRRGNLYSLFTEQSERRHLSQSLEREWQKSNSAGAKDSNDDEYGFKAIKKQSSS